MCKLELEDLKQFSRTNKHMLQIHHHYVIWDKLYQRDFWGTDFNYIADNYKLGPIVYAKTAYAVAHKIAQINYIESIYPNDLISLPIKVA